MDIPQASRRITDALALDTPPVALAFAAEAPAGVPGPPRPVPSACSFWRDAEDGPFFATAQEHYNCPIGSMVMGFPLPDEVQAKLGGLVTDMCEHNYFSPDEAPNLPAFRDRPAGIVYAPLSTIPIPPDVVLVWATPRQVMLCNEAMGTASWLSGTPEITGRPGCAALPLALDRGTPSFSLGCAGMRTFTEIGDDRILIAIPGGELEKFAEALEQTVKANDHITEYYQGERRRVADAAQS